MRSFNYMMAMVMLSFVTVTSMFAQDRTDTAYVKVLTGRALKIVNSLALTDTVQASRITNIIVDQYLLLNEIHEGSKTAIKEVKAKIDLAKDAQEAQITALKNKALASLYVLHFNFEGKVLAEVNNDILDKIKDGMTYGIFPRTYNAYLDMILTLKEEEKRYIYTCLLEAREQAIDAGSSDDKHAIFGKYKGRLNNYLASRGYDLKKEGDEWNLRIKAAEAAKKK